MRTENKIMSLQNMLEAASGGGAYPRGPGSYVLSRLVEQTTPCFFSKEWRASQETSTRVAFLLSHHWRPAEQVTQSAGSCRASQNGAGGREGVHGPQILICADVFCVGINQPSSSVRLSATPTACQSSLQAAPDPGRRSIPIPIPIR